MSTSQRLLRVLVVDDNADQAIGLSALLKRYGYESHVCVDAQECVASVEQLRPDVVLLDIAMPGKTGYDIADEIKSNPELRRVRLVAVTGHGMPLDRLQSSMLGFDQHLLKPVIFEDLEAVLKSVQDREE